MCFFCRHQGGTSADAAIKFHTGGDAIASLVYFVENPPLIGGTTAAAEKRKKEQEAEISCCIAKLRKYQFCSLPASKHDVGRIISKAPAPKAAVKAKAKAKAGSKAAQAAEKAHIAAASMFV